MDWLRMFRRAKPAAGAAAIGPRAVTTRAFLRGIAGVATAVGLGEALRNAPVAGATYTPGVPSDTVNTNLTVQGNLYVMGGANGPGNVGIGTSNPQGKLDVAGDIRINGSTAIGSDGVAKQSYYAP